MNINVKKIILKHKKRFIFFVTSLLGLVGFLVLSGLVNKDAFRSFDYDLMIGLQNSISRSVDLPFSLLTISGSSEFTAGVVLCVFLYYFIRKRWAIFSLFLFGTIFVIEILGKLFIYHPIPPPLLNRNVLPFRLPSSFFVHTNFSFPSGHMSRSAFIFGILLFLLLGKRSVRMRLPLTILLLVYIILMAVSRIYLGEHWFSDVAGGLLLGGSISLLSLAFW